MLQTSDVSPDHAPQATPWTLKQARIATRWAGVALLAAVGAHAPLGAAASGDQGGNETVIAVELNRADPVESGCRLSFVIRNATPYGFTSLQWDLITFAPDGLIADRMAAEVAPLRAGKTSVKQFDVPGSGCEQLGRLLLNDVPACETDGDAGEALSPLDCLGLIVPSSRTRIELFK